MVVCATLAFWLNLIHWCVWMYIQVKGLCMKIMKKFHEFCVKFLFIIKPKGANAWNCTKNLSFRSEFLHENCIKIMRKFQSFCAKHLNLWVPSNYNKWNQWEITAKLNSYTLFILISSKKCVKILYLLPVCC